MNVTLGWIVAAMVAGIAIGLVDHDEAHAQDHVTFEALAVLLREARWIELGAAMHRTVSSRPDRL